MPDLNTLRQLVTDVGPDTAHMLLGVFEKGAQKHLDALSQHIETGGELNELRRHAHSLKGLCATYGASKAAIAAETLQDACDTSDDDAIRTALEHALEIIPQDIEETLAAFQTLET